MRLDVTDGERDLLISILDAHLGDLREEIYKTEAADYKSSLKRREELLTSIIAKLRRVT